MSGLGDSGRYGAKKKYGDAMLTFGCPGNGPATGSFRWPLSLSLQREGIILILDSTYTVFTLLLCICHHLIISTTAPLRKHTPEFVSDLLHDRLFILVSHSTLALDQLLLFKVSEVEVGLERGWVHRVPEVAVARGNVICP